jgi:glutaredoxin
MLSDSCPFGAVSRAYGAFISDKCMTDRATVIIDKSGTVRYAESIGPDGGPRNMFDLVNAARAINGPPSVKRAGQALRAPTGIEYRLFVSGTCGFCHQVVQAVKNLHCNDAIDVRDVHTDRDAMNELLLRTAGKARVPTLVRLSDGQKWRGPKEIMPVLIAHSITCGRLASP